MKLLFPYLMLSRMGVLVVLVMTTVLYVWSTDTHAQSIEQQQRASKFCSVRSYEWCDLYRFEMSAAVDKIMTAYKPRLDKKPTAFAIRDVEKMNTQFKQMEALDTEWGMAVFLAYIRSYFDVWLVEYAVALETIEIPSSFVRDESWSIDILELRRAIIRELVDEWFDKFKSKPLSVWADSLLTADDAMNYSLNTTIYAQDDLDAYIAGLAISSDVQEFKITSDVRKNRSDIVLFKSTQDLQSLWYEVSSHRSRFNYDEAYRRTNIATAFSKIGHIRVLNPGQKFSFLEESQFDPSAQAIYQNGKVIFLDEEVDDYGGGLCGASTAIYQGIVTNKSLDRPALRNHSKWYTSLYTATIDGEKISMPGIDSTIYSRSLDLVLENTATYPIILVMNYDGAYQSEEEVFTLGRAGDRWNITYVSQYPYQTSIMKDWKSKKITWTCYLWNINGENKESCYKEVH